MRDFDWCHTYQDVTGLRDTCQRANMLCFFSLFLKKLVRYWALWKSVIKIPGVVGSLGWDRTISIPWLISLDSIQGRASY